MTAAKRLWPLLTATHRYDKSISTHGRGSGQLIDAPILAYLVETSNGRILYDVGCDHAKIADPLLRARHYDPDVFHFGAPAMHDDQRIPSYLARLGLSAADIDLVFIGHLHFDHAGGLADLRRCGCGAEVHVQARELAAAQGGGDVACFADEVPAREALRVMDGEYMLAPGVHAIDTAGHTAGHMSLMIELPKGPPVILAGDAADLLENIDDEVAPGACWNDGYEQAVASIRKLKDLARRERACLWPNHDFAFFRTLHRFPDWHE
jgi:N-acyl homoserine lactone hydrolase